MPLRHRAAGNRTDSGVETLLVHGFLTANLTFQPVAARSVVARQQLARQPSKSFFVELRDDHGKTLDRQSIAVFEPVACCDHQSNISIVDGRIALRKGASHLLLFKEDILIDERLIHGPPAVKLEWSDRQLQRHKDYVLRISCSEPAPDAYLQLFFQWDARSYRSVGFAAPQNELLVNVTHLPGGKTCRWIVAYTSGMRTSVATTATFAVPAFAPALRIVRPRQHAAFAPWHPITFEAELRDRRRENLDEHDLVWLLNGQEVRRGRLAAVQALPEGSYMLEVRLDGKEGIADRREFEVVPSKATRDLPANDWD